MPEPPATETVIVVHGTFSGRNDDGIPGWYAPDQTFCDQLNEELEFRGSSARCWRHLRPGEDYFHWDGANDWLSRSKAAARLQQQIRQLRSQGWTVHLVGHSHGGKVIIDAITDDVGRVEPWFSGRVVLLGTPIYRDSFTFAERRETLATRWSVASLVTWALLLFLSARDVDVLAAFAIGGPTEYRALIVGLALGTAAVVLLARAFNSLTSKYLSLRVLREWFVPTRASEPEGEERWSPAFMMVNSRFDEAYRSLSGLPQGPNPLLGRDSRGYDLRLMLADAADGLLNEGRKLVIVALVGTELHIRIFDANGKRVVDKAENELISGETLKALKNELNPLPDESGLSQEQKQKFIGDATSIARHTHSRSKRGFGINLIAVVESGRSRLSALVADTLNIRHTGALTVIGVVLVLAALFWKSLVAAFASEPLSAAGASLGFLMVVTTIVVTACFFDRFVFFPGIVVTESITAMWKALVGFAVLSFDVQIRNTVWGFMKSLSFGQSGAPRRVQDIEVSLMFHTSHPEDCVYLELPEDVVSGVTEAQKKRLGEIQQILYAKDLTWSVTHLREELASVDFPLIHTAYYRDAGCIQKVADWICEPMIKEFDGRQKHWTTMPRGKVHGGFRNAILEEIEGPNVYRKHVEELKQKHGPRDSKWGTGTNFDPFADIRGLRGKRLR